VSGVLERAFAMVMHEAGSGPSCARDSGKPKPEDDLDPDLPDAFTIRQLLLHDR
jgi:hypothetical protein